MSGYTFCEEVALLADTAQFFVQKTNVGPASKVSVRKMFGVLSVNSCVPIKVLALNVYGHMIAPSQAIYCS